MMDVILCMSLVMEVTIWMTLTLLRSSGDDVSRLEETMDSNNAAAETITSEFGEKIVSSSPGGCIKLALLSM